MLDQQKISMGRVRQAYGLTENEVEKVIQALWPSAVFPVELWRRAHETFWRAFADANQATHKIEGPILPEIELTAKYFHTHLCALDVMTFFRKLSLNIQSGSLREGFDFILEEAYEDTCAIFPEDRDFLFSALLRLDTVDIFEQYSPDSELFEEKILSIPISSYHFITKIFSDTGLVDKIAVIRHLRNYPLRQEVKGITHSFVASILNASAPEAHIPFALSVPQAAPAAAVERLDGKLVFRIPGSLWEGRPDAAIRDAMKADYRPSVIAYVLLNWCEVSKTQVGRLLFPDKEYTDPKSYRNVVDDLLAEADTYTIVKA